MPKHFGRKPYGRKAYGRTPYGRKAYGRTLQNSLLYDYATLRIFE